MVTDGGKSDDGEQRTAGPPATEKASGARVPVPSAGGGGSGSGGPISTWQALHWRSLSDGLLVAFIIAGPSMLAAVDLRGRAGRAWLIPIVTAGIGFLVGGGIAGRHRRLPSGAVAQGVAVGLPSSVTLVLADLLYRLIVRQSVDGAVIGYWFAGIVGAVVLSVVGGLIGRWLFLRSVRRRRTT
jgi:hypothetical protein